MAPYAIERAWVVPGQESTSVRTRNTNTYQLILQKVSTLDGGLQDPGTQMIPGVLFPRLSVGMGFLDPAGRTTGKLFPTGEPLDKVPFDGRQIPVTLIDAGAPADHPLRRVRGLTGRETAANVDSQAALLVHLDDARRDTAVRMGLAATRAEAKRAIPKLALVDTASPTASRTPNYCFQSPGKPEHKMTACPLIDAGVVLH